MFYLINRDNVPVGWISDIETDILCAINEDLQTQPE